MTESILLQLQAFFWSIVIGFGLIRYIIAVSTPTEYFQNDVLTEDQRKEYREGRNHNMILASFTIVAISIAIGLTGIEELLFEKIGLQFFSLALLSFFISATLFHATIKVWLPYVGDILEKVGILALVVGFLYLVSGVFQSDIILSTIFAGFLVGILIIVGVDTYINWKAFHPK